MPNASFLGGFAEGMHGLGSNISNIIERNRRREERALIRDEEQRRYDKKQEQYEFEKEYREKKEKDAEIKKIYEKALSMKPREKMDYVMQHIKIAKEEGNSEKAEKLNVFVEMEEEKWNQIKKNQITINKYREGSETDQAKARMAWNQNYSLTGNDDWYRTEGDLLGFTKEINAERKRNLDMKWAEAVTQFINTKKTNMLGTLAAAEIVKDKKKKKEAHDKVRADFANLKLQARELAVGEGKNTRELENLLESQFYAIPGFEEIITQKLERESIKEMEKEQKTLDKIKQKKVINKKQKIIRSINSIDAYTGVLKRRLKEQGNIIIDEEKETTITDQLNYLDKQKKSYLNEYKELVGEKLEITKTKKDPGKMNKKEVEEALLEEVLNKLISGRSK